MFILLYIHPKNMTFVTYHRLSLSTMHRVQEYDTFIL